MKSNYILYVRNFYPQKLSFPGVSFAMNIYYIIQQYHADEGNEGNNGLLCHFEGNEMAALWHAAMRSIP